MRSLISILILAGLLVWLNRSSSLPLARPTQEAILAPTPISLPSRLHIPKLNIDVPIEMVGLDSQNRMDVPKDYNQVGWYKYGPKPGETGQAVIAGHLDTPEGPAVFAHLNQLKVDDEIFVYDQDGRQFSFKVSSFDTYPDASFPIQKVFGTSSSPQLNLITCEGVFDRQSKNYSLRRVIYSSLVQ